MQDEIRHMERELRNIILRTGGNDISFQGVMYHYTSSPIIPRILQTHDETICLRFTDYRFLNDKSEGEEIMIQFCTVLRRLSELGEITSEFYDEAMRQKDNSASRPNTFYVMCFSDEKDSLPMWNYYLKDGKYQGYSLGFDFRFEEFFGEKAIYKRKVIYDDRAKQTLIGHLILEAATNESVSLSVAQRCELLLGAVGDLALVMKKSCFAHEHEVRLILDKALVPPSGTDAFTCSEIRHVDTNGVFVPYCNVSWNDKSVLKEICYAPTMPKQTELGLSSLLSTMGYDHQTIQITPSEIPVRY